MEGWPYEHTLLALSWELGGLHPKYGVNYPEYGVNYTWGGTVERALRGL